MSVSSFNKLIASGYLRRDRSIHVPNDIICLLAMFIPIELLPGFERQTLKYLWSWDHLELTPEKEGHTCASEKDKLDAKQKEAKITYGETLPCAILQILHKLNASQKTSFHDLGMGTGKMVMQAYLAYPNLKRCVGVEVIKPRYQYAEQHLHQLIEKGYRGRSFFMIEFMETQFFKVAEDVAHRKPVQGWREKDRVIAFHPVRRRSQMTVIDYHAVIISKCRDSDKYVVRYADDSVLTVEEKYLFIPGTERVLEIWYGSLFDYPHAFDTDLCMLTADFPDSKWRHLLNCISKTPIGCSVLLYQNLMKSRYFPWNCLKRYDFNVYDNDRYACSWSPGWRFYIFEHIEDATKRDVGANLLNNIHACEPLLTQNNAIFYKKKDADDEIPLKYGEVIGISDTKLMLKTTINEPQATTISIDTYNVFRACTKFKIGDRVSFYDYEATIVKKQAPELQDVEFGTIIAVEYGFYQIVSRNSMVRVRESLVFHLPQLRFKIGENVMACWPRNAQNRNCPNRCTRFRAVIKGISASGTYQLEYEPLSADYFEKTEPSDADHETDPYTIKKSYVPTANNFSHDHVREMWIAKY